MSLEQVTRSTVPQATTGPQLAEVRAAFLSAFDQEQFDTFLSDHFEFERPEHVGDGPFGTVVRKVVKWFRQRGLDAHLIAAVAGERPKNAHVQEVYRKYAEALLDEAWRQDVQAKQVAALERYGLLPDLETQVAGQMSGQRTNGPQRDRDRDGFERLIRAALPDIDPVRFAGELLRLPHRVCRLDLERRPVGTGFLVGPDLLLTNHHVLSHLIESRGDGRALTCVFGFHRGADGQPAGETRVTAAARWADWHVDSSPALSRADEHQASVDPGLDQLDHALVRLERPVGNEPIYHGGPGRGFIALPISDPPLVPGMPLAILQHPQARPLKLALDSNSIQRVNATGTRVRYATNTEPGASGAPCFDMDWNLVALHHFGDPHGRPPTYNQGIPISALRERLKRDGKAALLGGSP